MLSRALGLIFIFYTLKWVSPVIIPSDLPSSFTITKPQQLKTPLPLNKTAKLGSPSDPCIISRGVYSTRFSDFEPPTWPTIDILHFASDVHQNLRHIQEQHHSGLDDGIPGGIYDYSEIEYHPPLWFRFQVDVHTSTRELTFRDMFNVMYMVRRFAREWEFDENVPSFDLELELRGGPTGHTREGYGMLGFLVGQE